MKKIRNINVQGNVFSYAGPVGGGRSSRKSPESFSSASPPVSFNSVINLLKRTMLAVAIFSALLAMSCADKAGLGHQHEFSGEWEFDDKNHWQICPDDAVKGNIAAHNMGWTVIEPATKTSTGIETGDCTVCNYDGIERTLDKLPETSGVPGATIPNLNVSLPNADFNRADVCNAMRATHGSNGVLLQQVNEMLKLEGNLADNIRSTETVLSERLLLDDSVVVLGIINGRYMALINELCVLSENPNAYKGLIIAYKEAAYLNQTIGTSQTRLNTLIQNASSLGLSVPDGVTPALLKELLEQELVANMPAVGEDRITGLNILQQVGDFGEFEGLVTDIRDKGFHPSTDLNDIGTGRSVRPREALAAAAGIVK